LFFFKEINNRSLLLIILPLSIYVTASTNARHKIHNKPKTWKELAGWGFF